MWREDSQNGTRPAGWAQDASADAATLPAVTVTASRDDAATQTDRIDGGALGSRKQVDTPFSTHVVSTEEGEDLMSFDLIAPIQTLDFSERRRTRRGRLRERVIWTRARCIH